MLRINNDIKTVKLPLKSGVVTGACTLDEDWRAMDYKNIGSHLSFSVALTYEVPLEDTDVLFNQGLVSISSDDLEDNERNLILLDFDIIHSDYDPNSGKIIMHQEFPRFPEPSFLEGYQFSEQTLRASNVWFPGFGAPAVFSHVSFGFLKGNFNIGFNCKGSAIDAVAEMTFAIEEESVPLQYDFQVAGYADEFMGFSKEEIIKEIEDCFASLYKRQDYNAHIKITDANHGGVRISYRLKG